MVYTCYQDSLRDYTLGNFPCIFSSRRLFINCHQHSIYWTKFRIFRIPFKSYVTYLRCYHNMDMKGIFVNLRQKSTRYKKFLKVNLVKTSDKSRKTYFCLNGKDKLAKNAGQMFSFSTSLSHSAVNIF